jgi:outer membrane protein TolC
MAFILLAFVAAAFSGSAPALEIEPATEPSSVERMVRLALESNPELQALRQQVLAAEQRPAQAGALPDPTADLELMNLSVDKPRIDDALTEGISVGLTQEIPWPGKRGVAASMARSETEVARARLRARESMIRGEVIGVAYELVMLDRLLQLNDETRGALEEAARTAGAVYSSGIGAQADILLAQTAVTATLTAREGLEARRGIARARLESLLGGAGGEDTAGVLSESFLDAVILPHPGFLPPLESLLAELPETSPEVLMGRAEEQVREQNVEIARLDFKPDFMVGGRYRFRDMSMGGGDFLTAMVGITLPFFHRRDRYRPALEEARLRQEGARHETEAVLVGERYALAEAWQRADRDRRLHGLYRDGLLIQARQAYESTLAVYSVGRADFPSLLMTLTGLYDVQGEVVMAQAGFQEAVAMIEATLGRPLDPGEIGNRTGEGDAGEGPGGAPVAQDLGGRKESE